MTNKKYILATILSLALAQGALAADSKQSDSPVSVGVDARVRYEANKYDNDDNITDAIRAEDINVTVTAQLSEKIRANIRANLSKVLGAGTAKDKLEAAIEEATIEIREINGTPIAAVIFGKQKVAFGEIDTNMPGYKDSLLYQLMNQDQVIGVTVELKEVLGFAIAASAFENSSGDMQFGDGWGFSAEASRQLTQNLRLRASGMMQQKGSSSDFGDKRATVGLVYENNDGSWTAHLDGLYFDGAAGTAAGTHYGANAGVAVKAGVGTVRVEASYLEATAYEVAAAYDIPLSDNLVITPSLRYTTDANGNNGDAKAMVEARVRMGNQPQAVK